MGKSSDNTITLGQQRLLSEGGKKTVKSPSQYSVVRHTGWRREDDPNYPCLVLITGGAYLRNGRVSNHWTWRRITEDGTLAEEENGYGSFEITRESQKVTVKVTVEV